MSKIITVPFLRRWYWINYHWVVTVIPVTHWMFGVDSGEPQKWPRHTTQDLRMIGEVFQDLKEISAPRCLKFCSGWSQIRGRCLRRFLHFEKSCEFQHMRTSIHTQLSRPFSAHCPLCGYDHSCNCGDWLSSGKPLCHIIIYIICVVFSRVYLRYFEGVDIHNCQRIWWSTACHF